MLSTSSKIEGVSKNCFVYNLVKIEDASKKMLSCCQVKKNEDVLQKSLVFKLADSQIDRTKMIEIDRHKRKKER